MTFRHKSAMQLMPAGFSVDKHCELEEAGAEALTAYYNEHVRLSARLLPVFIPVIPCD